VAHHVERFLSDLVVKGGGIRRGELTLQQKNPQCMHKAHTRDFLFKQFQFYTGPQTGRRLPLNNTRQNHLMLGTDGFGILIG